MLRGSKRALFFGEDYTDKLLSLFVSSIIAYYPGNEPLGSDTAYDLSGHKYHGAYTGVTLGQPGIGDGLTCPLYDGSTSFMQPPAGFRTAFNGSEGTVLIWLKVFNSAVWTDGVARDLFIIQVDGSNRVWMQKQSGANSLQYNYTAGATVKSAARSSTTIADWIHLAITWSLSADQVINYYAGAKVGATLTGLGTWAGVPAAATTVLGAASSTPNTVLNGWLAHWLVLNRAATPGEVAQAAIVQ